jgi:hypothetical protein
MAEGQLQDLFFAYEANLRDVEPSRTPAGVILCPLDLAPMPIDKATLEHIVPQHSTVEKKQKTLHTKLGSKNVRSGLTLTCLRCNGKKGSELDSELRGLIVGGDKNANAYSHRSGVAILTYAYLFAFAVFGYEYILRKELDEVRLQFEEPDTRHTGWLEDAQVHPGEIERPIVANEWGYPFAMGNGRADGAPLEVLFWRFRAKLPTLTGIKTAVSIPDSVRVVMNDV